MQNVERERAGALARFLHSAFRILRSAFAVVFLASPLPAQQVCDEGAYYLARGDFARALRSLSAIRDSGSSTASTLNLRGIAELMNGHREAALAFFDRALAADAAYGVARFNRGVALLQLGRGDAAAKEFETIWADTASPYRAKAAYHHALADDAAKRYADAARWLERALEVQPDLAEAILYLGVIREKLGEFEAAGRAYRDFLGYHPDSIVATLRFGVAAYRAGYADTAKKYLREVVARAPGSTEAAEARKFLFMWE